MGTTAYGTPARTRPVTPGMQSGEPAFSPDGRYVAVGIGHNTGDGMAFSVVVVEAASGRRRVVARPGSVTVAPAWSPDGRRIAYGAGVYPEAQIRVVDADGRGDRVLVAMPGRDRQLRSPVWSRDGGTMYFLVADGRAFGSPATAVWSAAADGGRPRRVAPVARSIDRLAPDPAGRTLLLSSWFGAGNQRLELRTGAVHRLRGAVAHLATWEDRRTVIGYRGDSLVRFRLAGTRLRRIGSVTGFRSKAGTQRWFGVSVRACAS
ncbi:MAG: hypothetical protein ACXVJ7_18350 [Acidimicrobiia bacterium]